MHLHLCRQIPSLEMSACHLLQCNDLCLFPQTWMCTAVLSITLLSHVSALRLTHVKMHVHVLQCLQSTCMCERCHKLPVIQNSYDAHKGLFNRDDNVELVQELSFKCLALLDV
jgi:hypothetical protein